MSCPSVKSRWCERWKWHIIGGSCVLYLLIAMAIRHQMLQSPFRVSVEVRSVEDGTCDITGMDTKSPLKICHHILANCDLEKFSLSKRFFCPRGSHTKSLLTGLILLQLVMIFVTFGIITSNFLYPNLDTLSTHLNISKRISGLTLLAFGNATPDIFSTYNAMNSNSSNLAIGELIGSANFVICFIIGAMGILKPFRVNTFEFLKDLIFFTVFMLVALFFLIDEELHTFECCLMIILYFTYVCYSIFFTNEGKDLEEQLQADINSDSASVVSAIGRVSPLINDDENKLRGLQKLSVHDALHLWKSDLLLANDNENLLPKGELQRSRSLHETHTEGNSSGKPLLQKKSASFDLIAQNPKIHSPVPQRTDVPTITIEDESDENTQLIGQEESLFLHDINERKHTLKKCLAYLINPYVCSDIYISKVHNLITLPLVVFFNLLIPVYDSHLLEQEDHKVELRFRTSLFHLQTIITPLIIHYYTPILSTQWMLVVIPVLVLASYAKSLHKYTIPALGFFCSICAILISSSQLIIILQNVGVIFHISESLLGMTVLALGNSIGDLISNLTFVKLNLSIIGINACFGSPLLYILFGIGLNGLIINMKQHTSTIMIELDTHFKVSGVALITQLLFYAIAVPNNDWWIDRKIGATACVWWVLITCVNVYLEVTK